MGGARLPKDLNTIARPIRVPPLFNLRRRFTRRAGPWMCHCRSVRVLRVCMLDGAWRLPARHRIHGRGSSRARLGARVGIASERAPEPELALRKCLGLSGASPHQPPLHHFTTPPLHHSITPILRCSITPLLRRSFMLYSRPMTTTTDELERSVTINRALDG